MFENYPDVLTVKQMAEAFNIGSTCAYRLIKSKEIESFNIGGSIRIPKTCLIEYITKNSYNNIENSIMNNLPNERS